MTFTTGNVKGSDYCCIGDFGTISGSEKTHLTGCIGKIIAFYETLNDKRMLHIHKHLMKKWDITDTIISY